MLLLTTGMPASATPASTPTSLTIDELAAQVAVPTRTIRFYQARGALMKPEIRGRVAFYGDVHIERLKLIAQLQDRGLRIDAIRDLMTALDRGEVDLAEWLGIEHEVAAPWADDAARTVDDVGLRALTGSDRPGLVAELIRARLIERRGDVFLIPSPALLTISVRLSAAGIALDTGAAAGALLRKHLRRAVKDLVELFVRGVKDGAVTISSPETTFATLRPLGTEAVKVMFGREMELALRELLESGAVRSLRPVGSRKRKR
jgi:DNA-binding transcriptional MerR regulator